RNARQYLLAAVANESSNLDYIDRFTISAPLTKSNTIPVTVDVFPGDGVNLDTAVSSGDGSYVTVWQGPSLTPGGGSDIFARRYHQAGVPISTATVVSTSTANDQTQPSIAMDADGNYIVVW